MLLLAAVYGLLLVFCGAYDFRKNIVPDVASSAAWLLCIFLPGNAIGVVVATFGTIFFVHAVYVAWTGKVAYAWADILLLPTYAGFVVLIFSASWAMPLSIMFALPMVASGLVMAKTNKPQPFITYLAIFYLIALAYSSL